MLIAVFVGTLSGVIGTLCWLAMQLMLNKLGAYAQLAQSCCLVPPVMGAGAAILHTIARTFQRRGVSDRSVHSAKLDRRQALADIFESYHFGIFILHPFNWIARGLVSAANAFLGGIFGIEGSILEFSFAALPILSRYVRLFIGEKQAFVICTLSSTLAVALGAPFSGCLIALELVHALDSRAAAGAVLSALTAYGTAMLLQTTILSGIFVETSSDRLNVLGALFTGFKPINLELFQSGLISVAAICTGLGVGLLIAGVSRALDRGSDFFAHFFKGRFQLAMIVTGILIGITVWLVPESYVEPSRAWEELAWMRLSTARAIVLLATEAVVLILAFSGWGSSGLFSPVLMLGALFGYALGNAVGSSWAIPLAIAGSASALAAMFRVPIAAAALVLEIGHDGPMWWLATLAVLSSTLICRSLGVKAIQDVLLERAGIRLLGGRAISVLAGLKASQAMLSDVRVISERSGLQEMRAAAAESNHNFIGVVSATDGTFVGLISLEQLPGRVRHALRPDAHPANIATVERVIEIRDLIERTNPIVRLEDSLELALARLDDSPCVVVVDQDRKLQGFLFDWAIEGVYKREIASTVLRQS